MTARHFCQRVTSWVGVGFSVPNVHRRIVARVQKSIVARCGHALRFLNGTWNVVRSLANVL